MGHSLQIGIAGLVAIGMITALVLPGRNTAQVIMAGGNAGSNLLGTAITGNK